MKNKNAAKHEQADAPQLHAVAPGVWAYIQPYGGWMVNNMGFIEGTEGNISIDVTSTEPRTAAYLSTMESVTSMGVRHLIYTHAHPDHCNGSSLVPHAVVVAHENVPSELHLNNPVPDHVFTSFEQGSVQARQPELTFDHSLTLLAGDRLVHVVHPGVQAHTTGDSYVWIPDSKVLFAGDLLFNGGTPFLLSGSTKGWLDALAQLRSLNPQTIVPGHGPIGGSELITATEDYLGFVWDAAKDGLAKGLEPLEAAFALDLGRFGALLDSERIVGNLHSAYAELSGGAVDHQVVFQEMFEYNGNKPLICTA